MERRVRQAGVDRERSLQIEEYTKQIANIQTRLDRGTDTIKRGHRVTGLSHAGEVTVVPLTERQIARLSWHQDILQFRMTHGPKAIVPVDLRAVNPSFYRRS